MDLKLSLVNTSTTMFFVKTVLPAPLIVSFVIKNFKILSPFIFNNYKICSKINSDLKMNLKINNISNIF